MRFAGVADPEDQAMLQEIFERYCAENSGLDQVERSDMEAIILALYLDGVTTCEGLQAALAGAPRTKQ